MGGRRDWEAFWNLLLIDRRTIGENARPYAPTVQALLDGLEEMVAFDERYIAAAASADGVAWARDGTRPRVAPFVPRMVPSSQNPQREILRVVPTYYALPPPLGVQHGVAHGVRGAFLPHTDRKAPRLHARMTQERKRNRAGNTHGLGMTNAGGIGRQRRFVYAGWGVTPRRTTFASPGA